MSREPSAAASILRSASLLLVSLGRDRAKAVAPDVVCSSNRKAPGALLGAVDVWLCMTDDGGHLSRHPAHSAEPQPHTLQLLTGKPCHTMSCYKCSSVRIVSPHLHLVAWNKLLEGTMGK